MPNRALGMPGIHIPSPLLASIVTLGLSGCSGELGEETRSEHATWSLSSEKSDTREVLLFSDAKLLIEHNATAEDTGFQGFVDGDPWKALTLRDIDGRPVLRVNGQGELRTLGLTELFFETNEPPNEEVPIEEVLARLPEGEYQYEGKSVEGFKMEGTARLTHDIPQGPVMTAPLEGAVVDPNDLAIAWNAVTKSIRGEDVTIVAYQLIVEKDVEVQPHPDAFAKQVLSVHVLPSVTSVTVPKEFLEPDTAYRFEVLAIEDSGNQTLTESSFATK